MALLLSTKIRPDGLWVMSKEDAKVLVEALKHAIEESVDHQTIWPVNINFVAIDENTPAPKNFIINVHPNLEKKKPEVASEPLKFPIPPQKPQKPQEPLDRLIREDLDPKDNCPLCRSNQIRKWSLFGKGKILGCLQPECENYYKK